VSTTLTPTLLRVTRASPSPFHPEEVGSTTGHCRPPHDPHHRWTPPHRPSPSPHRHAATSMSPRHHLLAWCTPWPPLMIKQSAGPHLGRWDVAGHRATTGALHVVTIPNTHGAPRGRAGLAGVAARLGCGAMSHKAFWPIASLGPPVQLAQGHGPDFDPCAG
jgi:hypothetical protein